MLPARQNNGRKPVSRGITLPAPTSGWYVGTNLADAPPLTAYQLDNYFPEQDYVRLRKGSLEYATGLTNPVVRMWTYEAGSTNKLFASTSSAIYDVTLGGTIGAAAVSGQTSGDWQFVQMSTSGGTFIRGVNGADTPQLYDGSSWSTTPAISGSGLTPANLNAVFMFKNRLYFIEKDSLNVWYLPVDSIAGTATKLPLGGVFALGGNLIAGASWAISSNSGLYETCVFITDRGEVAMYDGSYPGDTAWTLKGLYRIGKPLSRECIMKAGGDLAIMTEDGIVPMSKVMTLDRIALANEAVTQPIAPEWRRAVSDRLDMDGWSITVWPLKSMAVICLPQLDTNDKTQYVANARSGAWCRFTGWDARCFAVVNNKLYYGTSDGRVLEAESGGTDDGDLYTAKMIWSWQDLKAGAVRKQIKAMRPVYRATFNVAPQLECLVDYNATTSAAPSASAAATSGAQWGSAVWGTDVWPGELRQAFTWQAVGGFGTALAPTVQISISSNVAPDFRLQQIDAVYEIGGIIG